MELGIKELFGHRTMVHYSQFVHYLLSELEYWSREMGHYCQIVSYLAVP